MEVIVNNTSNSLVCTSSTSIELGRLEWDLNVGAITVIFRRMEMRELSA